MRFLHQTFLCLFLCGCAAVGKSKVQSPASKVLLPAARPEVVIWPAVALHVWFLCGTNFPASDEWTNVWTFTALTSPDLKAPVEQWTASTPALEPYLGHLGFEIEATGPQLFCRAIYRPKGAP